ncbi:MAG: hypothetical protein ACP5M9_01115 [Candidatus Micrarchaeia archaeon]
MLSLLILIILYIISLLNYTPELSISSNNKAKFALFTNKQDKDSLSSAKNGVKNKNVTNK